MAEELRINSHACGTAMTIFHLYQKSFPYTEFDRFMVASLCMFIASKVDYLPHIKIYDIVGYYYKNRKGPKGKYKPLEEVKDALKE